MKKYQENNIDNLFKRGLENPVDKPDYSPDDWDALEQMLDKDKKRTIVLWLPILSSVAAILLLVFGIWWYKAQNGVVKVKSSQTIAKLKPSTLPDIITSNKSNLDDYKKLVASIPVNNKYKSSKNARFHNVINQKHANIVAGTTTKTDSTIQQTFLAKAAEKKEVNSIITYTDSTSIAGKRKTDILVDNYNMSNNAIDVKTTANTDKTIGSNMTSDTTDTARLIAKKSIKATSKGSSFKPTFAVSIIASTELNSTESLSENKAGSNLGLLFSVGVTRKFTISTGATYAIKPYYTDFSDFYTTYKFASNPTSIMANCRVLDIPLNIDYQLFNKHRNKFSIGTGISSYIMLHESYDYTYMDPTAQPATFQVKNPSKYLFSILNLQATYQRQITSKVGLSLQPYYKLPLADIDSARVRLQTLGVAVGFNMNLSGLRKK